MVLDYLLHVIVGLAEVYLMSIHKLDYQLLEFQLLDLLSETFVGLSTAGLLSSTSDAFVGLSNLTGASANTYGSSSTVPQIVVDSNGRITGITNVLISGGGGGGGTSIIVKDSGSLVGTHGSIDFGTVELLV